jgi:hypothetical protein
MNPDLRAFLSRVPNCDFLFQPQFYKECGDVVARGPDENTQKSVMGRYFPGRALPPSINDPKKLDFLFQQPAKPNELAKKWASIAVYRCGLIVGPSGSGKVCSLYFPPFRPHLFFFSSVPFWLGSDFHCF